MTRRLVAVLVLLAAGCGGTSTEPPGVAEQIQADPDLAALSRDISGEVPAQRADVDELVAAAATSVRDMSRLDAAAFEAEHGRPAGDQAQLVGEWLAGADGALRGRVAAVELGEAATAADLAPETQGLRAQDAVRDLALKLASSAPNEPSDNPALPGAASLRSTLQSAFAAAG